MTFKKGDKVFVEFEVLDTCHSSDYMLVKDKSNQTRQFLKSEAQAVNSNSQLYKTGRQ